MTNKRELQEQIDIDEQRLSTSMAENSREEVALLLERLEKNYEIMSKLGECAPCK